MKCVSCETEINPKWRHAIDINVCPFCGKYILEEHLKNLFTSLATTMESLQNYPDQLNDWLLSNYNYIKTDSLNLKDYLPKEALKEMRKELDNEEFQEKKKSIVKVKTGDGKIEEVIVEKVQSDAKANGFFERAEAFKSPDRDKEEDSKSVSEKTQHLKKMAQQIKSDLKEGSKGHISQAHLASMINSEINNETLENSEVAELQAAIDGGNIVSGLPDPADGTDEDDRIPSAVLAMASRAKNNNNAVNKDLETLHEMQNKVKNAQKKLASGKGGFSRT